MGTPFLGEIKIMSFGFAPQPGWAFCNGQFLPINQNQALFSLLGTQFGGNGQTTFALPDLRGQVPRHIGKNLIGQFSGEPAHTLAMAEMTQHFHFGQVQPANATTGNPTNNFLGGVPTFAYRNNLSNLKTLLPASVTNVGGSQPHENRQPFLVLNFCIALQGIFPSRN